MTASWKFLLERPEIEFPRSLLKNVFTGKTIVITGAAGSVGASLSRLAGEFTPKRLVLVDAHEASLVRLSRDLGSQPGEAVPEFVLGDVRDRRKMLQILRRHDADVIFHLAAYKQVPIAESNADQFLDVNVLGTVNMVECARETGVSRLVYPSTDKSVSPSSLYGASKRIVERYLQAMAIDSSNPGIRIVRLVNVFGTQGSVVEIFARQIRADQPITITDPAMDRFWITMHEATQLLAAAVQSRRFEGIYLLDVGDPVPILRTATTLGRALRPTESEPNIRIIGARPGERLHEYLTSSDEQLRPTDLPGLLVIELPTPTVSAAEWAAELRTLARRLFEVEPSLLRDWAFDVSTGRVPWPSRADLTVVGAGPGR